MNKQLTVGLGVVAVAAISAGAYYAGRSAQEPPKTVTHTTSIVSTPPKAIEAPKASGDAKQSETKEDAPTPEETATGLADAMTDYDGASYQNINLGISFKEFKRLLDEKHKTVIMRPKGDSSEDEMSCYESCEHWELGKGAWKPNFWFLDVNGVNLLTQIDGEPDEQTQDSLADLISILTTKYGDPQSLALGTENRTWFIGTKVPTVITVVKNSFNRFSLIFSHKALYDEVLKRKKAKAPGL